MPTAAEPAPHAEPAAGLQPRAGDKDVAIAFNWGGDRHEEASVLIVRAALAKNFGAIVHEPDAEVFLLPMISSPRPAKPRLIREKGAANASTTPLGKYSRSATGRCEAGGITVALALF